MLIFRAVRKYYFRAMAVNLSSQTPGLSILKVVPFQRYWTVCAIPSLYFTPYRMTKNSAILFLSRPENCARVHKHTSISDLSRTTSPGHWSQQTTDLCPKPFHLLLNMYDSRDAFLSIAFWVGEHFYSNAPKKLCLSVIIRNAGVYPRLKFLNAWHTHLHYTWLHLVAVAIWIHCCCSWTNGAPYTYSVTFESEKKAGAVVVVLGLSTLNWVAFKQDCERATEREHR